MSRTFGIGELARETGCNIETIRYYERIGVIPQPPRTGGRYRIYDADDIRRVSFVRRARELGFGLDEVRSLLRFATEAEGRCAEVRQLAVDHVETIRAKIIDLRRIEMFLENFIGRCQPGSRERCGILEMLLGNRPPGIPSKTNQGGGQRTTCCGN